MEEKPLHVQVAEALGWTGLTNERTPWWYGHAPEGLKLSTGGVVRDGSGRHAVPEYDTDWSATGPLIERYKLTVIPNQGDAPGVGPWCATIDDQAIFGEGVTALTAVCNLILALQAAGKLPPETA